MSKHIKRMSRHSIAEVFEHIDASPNRGVRIRFFGTLIYMRTTRMLNFRIHGIVCVDCGIRGAFFYKDRSKQDAPHLNLYAFNKKSGKLLLMTQDHIRPKSKGGTNSLYNMQIMCLNCNGAKGEIGELRIKLNMHGAFY